MLTSCRIIPQAVSVRYDSESNHEGRNNIYTLLQIWIVDRCCLCPSGPCPYVHLRFARLTPLLTEFSLFLFSSHCLAYCETPGPCSRRARCTHLQESRTQSFLQFHRTGEEPLRDDEISILNGVLELNTKNVEAIMTPMEVYMIALYLPKTELINGQDVVSLSSDTILDHKTIDAMQVLCLFTSPSLYNITSSSPAYQVAIHVSLFTSPGSL